MRKVSTLKTATDALKVPIESTSPPLAAFKFLRNIFVNELQVCTNNYEGLSERTSYRYHKIR